MRVLLNGTQVVPTSHQTTSKVIPSSTDTEPLSNEAVVDKLFTKEPGPPEFASSSVTDSESYDETSQSESEGDVELDFERLLAFRNLKVRRLLRDPMSVFRAIADQVYGNQSNGGIVKNDCIHHWRSSKEKFGPMPVSEANLGSSRRNATWELEVLADRYQRSIEIYVCSPGDHDPTVITPKLDTPLGEPIRLSVHRGNQYNSLLVRQKNMSVSRKVRISDIVEPPPNPEQDIIDQAIRDSFTQGQKQLVEEVANNNGVSSYNSSIGSDIQTLPKLDVPINKDDGLGIKFNITLDLASQIDLHGMNPLNASDPSIQSNRSSVSTITGLGGIGARIAQRNFHSPVMSRREMQDHGTSSSIGISGSCYASEEGSSYDYSGTEPSTCTGSRKQSIEGSWEQEQFRLALATAAARRQSPQPDLEEELEDEPLNNELQVPLPKRKSRGC